MTRICQLNFGFLQRMRLCRGFVLVDTLRRQDFGFQFFWDKNCLDNPVIKKVDTPNNWTRRGVYGFGEKS
ncbi:MAG: hypothetical protein AAF349_09655 [Cyanobacteria bacterium P01_A01_bin.68]